jgi:hypothetical protein
LRANHSSFLAAVVASLLILGVFQPFALGEPQTQDTTGKQIEVRLIPEKKTVKAGEVLKVRVEIWNVGTSPLFIKKAIYDPCGPAPLSLRLELGRDRSPNPDTAAQATASTMPRTVLRKGCSTSGPRSPRGIFTEQSSPCTPKAFHNSILRVDGDWVVRTSLWANCRCHSAFTGPQYQTIKNKSKDCPTRLGKGR